MACSFFLASAHHQGWDDPSLMQIFKSVMRALSKDSKQAVSKAYLALQKFTLLKMKTTMDVACFAIWLAKSDSSLFVKGEEKQAYSDTVDGIK